MDGLITGENDERIGLSVIDNNDIEHVIEMEFDGEIKYHEQDGYSDDPAERTANENEHVSQAREYARYHVWQETEYEPFPVERNLPGIQRVKAAIDALSTAAIEDYFEELYKQVKGRGPRTERPVPLPDVVDDGDYVAFLVDVYLDENGDIEAVSDIHLRHYDANRQKVTQWNEDPYPDRKADARLQLQHDWLPSIEHFQEYLSYHLRCQLRDCYITAGMEPPEEYKVLGIGREQPIGRYRNPEITLYEEYHDHAAEIPGYELEFDYGLGTIGKLSSKFASLGQNDEQLDDAIDQFLLSGGDEDAARLVELLEDRGYSDPETSP